MLNRSNLKKQKYQLVMSLIFSLALSLFSINISANDSARGQASTQVSLDQALDLVKRQTGGKIMKAFVKESYYRIKVLTPDGRVKHINIDRASGAIIR